MPEILENINSSQICELIPGTGFRQNGIASNFSKTKSCDMQVLLKKLDFYWLIL